MHVAERRTRAMRDATNTRRRVATSIAFAFVGLGYAAGALAWAPSGNDGIHRAASMRAPMLLRRPIFERRSELATSRSAASDRTRQERPEPPRGDARGAQGHEPSPLILVQTGRERNRGSRTPYANGDATR